MSKRTVRAIKAENGLLKLLEAVELPAGQEVSVTIEIPEVQSGQSSSKLPIRNLGPMKQPIDRDSLYADLV